MAHSASGSMAGQLPLAAPSFFFSVFLMILLMASTCPLDCGCAGDAKKILMLNREQRCRNHEQLNYLPLSVTMALFGDVIDGYDCELKLTCALRHGADEIESPLGEWPWASHRIWVASAWRVGQ
ncbi:unnamed protein product [Prunus brigantina]